MYFLEIKIMKKQNFIGSGFYERLSECGAFRISKEALPDDQPP